MATGWDFESTTVQPKFLGWWTEQQMQQFGALSFFVLLFVLAVYKVMSKRKLATPPEARPWHLTELQQLIDKQRRIETRLAAFEVTVGNLTRSMAEPQPSSVQRTEMATSNPPSRCTAPTSPPFGPNSDTGPGTVDRSNNDNWESRVRRNHRN